MLFFCPMYLEPADAAAADCCESLHSVPYPAASSEYFDPTRLAMHIHSTVTNGLSSAVDATEIEADILNSLPKWAQAVIQTGCFHEGMLSSFRIKSKRRSEQQHEKSQKRKSIRYIADQESLAHDKVGELQNKLNVLTTSQDADTEQKDFHVLPLISTHAEFAAESVEQYSELLNKLIKNVMGRHQADTFEQKDIDVFQAEEVKLLLHSLKAMKKKDWIEKLRPELLLSLMSAFDDQVQLGLAVNSLGFNLLTELKEKSQNDKQITRLLASVDVAICELIVMATSQIDRRILSEEIINNCFQLLHQTIRSLLPYIDSSFVTSLPVAKLKEEGKFNNSRSLGTSRVNLRLNKSARNVVERISHVVCEFMDQLASLSMSLKLSDHWIFCLSSSLVPLFALDHSSYATSLQQSALGILRSIYMQYKLHRESLLADIVDIMVKLPTAKRTLRTVKLQNSNDSVQRISTLVVSLIQCSAASQEIGFAEMLSESDTFAEGKCMVTIDKFKIALEDTKNDARIFVRKLLKACWKKIDDRDNRVVLDNFVEDLLIMFVRPEWIGAEELLEVLSSSLASVLHTNVCEGVTNLNFYHSAAALTLIGRMCAAIKVCHRKASQIGWDDNSASAAVLEEHASTLCAAIAAEKNDMSVARDEHLRKLAFKHIVVTHLQRHNSDQGDSKKLLILKFLLESEVHWSGTECISLELEKKLWKSQWERPNGSLSSAFKVPSPTIELALESSLCLAVKRGFCGLFDKLFAHIMALLSKGAPILKARVMKCLRGIVDVDPMLMAESSVQIAVEKCCVDEKSSVREAAVDLIGTYVLLRPTLLDRYFGVLAERIRDKGVKVRKSVCKIFKTAILMQDHARTIILEQEFRRKSACMLCLVERVGNAAEDQALKKFIMDIFQEVWFGANRYSSENLNLLDAPRNHSNLPGSGTAPLPVKSGKYDMTTSSDKNTKFVSEDGSFACAIEEGWVSSQVPTVMPSCILKSYDYKLDNSAEVIATIIEVTHGTPNREWFTKLLKSLLVKSREKNISQSTTNSRAQIAADCSKKIVDRLVNCLIELQEGTLVQGVSIDKAQEQFVACMTALSAFCEARPQLLTHHLETIRVYLNEKDIRIPNLCVSMISKILGIKRVSYTIAIKLEDDLKFLVRRSSPSVVGLSIECLAMLSAARNHEPVLLLELLEQFYLCICKYKQRTSLAGLSDQEDYVLQRALYVAGKIVSSTDVDKCPALSKKFKVLKIGMVASSLYELYRNFVRMPGNDACAAKAVQGMGFLFLNQPRLFLSAQQDGLLTFLLTADTRKAKLQCLVSMKELLLFEEVRLEKGLASKSLNQSKSTEQQVQGDQEADASLIGNVMQAELVNILQLSLHKVPQIRKEAIACIKALLRQGLINPLQCIPNLVALETDRVPYVRDAAYSILLALHERYRSQLHSPLIKGFRDSYYFQLSVYGDATALGIDEKEKAFCLFGRLFINCIKPSRSHEMRLLRALINQFTDQWSVPQPFKGKSPMPNSNIFTSSLKYMCYVAQVLSSLPYDVEDEPLYVIYLISRYVSLRFSPLMDDLKKAFVEAGVLSTQLEEDNANLSTLTLDEYSLHLEPDCMLSLQMNGLHVFAIALMLRLKFALKRNYQLDDEKCATFVPAITDFSVEAKGRAYKKLLLPSVDDLCQPEDPILVSWNLYMVARFAAREDQMQLNFDLKKSELSAVKGQSRSRRMSASSKQKLVTKDSNDEFADTLA
ncbi:uncharacterized protein CCR75_005142 [Bremia lactucae]|uniref:Sister chromatid cohesion protein n=1 Tax=Bremia lactucae TaxID=4779 RepID=A0A976FPC4_BRELC|nr:hypothetical protein CCR75_005142 [Bremia lactucae]